MYMLRGPVGLGGLGEGDRVFQVGHARNQHWSRLRSKRRKRVMSLPATLTIRRPDDWHVHLRDGAMLEACAVHTARQFARAIIMPNLVPPVTTVAEAAAYRERILQQRVPAELDFEPLMTCYLTDGADPAELAARQAGGRVGRGQALSGACHDQLGAWRHLDGHASRRRWRRWRRPACRCWSMAR